jgi:hypothetical protein
MRALASQANDLNKVAKSGTIDVGFSADRALNINSSRSKLEDAGKYIFRGPGREE